MRRTDLMRGMELFKMYPKEAFLSHAVAEGIVNNEEEASLLYHALSVD